MHYHHEGRPRSRNDKVKPFLAMEILERAQALTAEGRSIIHLEIGDPDFPTPPVVVEAAQRALGEGATKYTHSLGLRPLREAIAQRYATRYGVEVSPDRILVTLGSSAALTLAVACALEEGDTLLLTDPTYACYPAFAHLVGARIRCAPLSPDTGFRVTLDALRPHLEGAKAVLINSPANPTGLLVEEGALAELAESGVTVISDEIYHGLTYTDQRERSLLEFTHQGFVVDGFSKRYSMTGWRLGWLVAPETHARIAQTWQQNLFISASQFAQVGGIAALTQAEPEVERMRGIYRQRRDLMVGRLRAIGFGVPVMPEGAYYVLADARRWTENALQFAREITEESGVACTAGDDFGELTRGFLRFSYANSIENIAEAMDRLETMLKAR